MVRDAPSALLTMRVEKKKAPARAGGRFGSGPSEGKLVRIVADREGSAGQSLGHKHWCLDR
jgi:hypothetical protein